MSLLENISSNTIKEAPSLTLYANSICMKTGEIATLVKKIESQVDKNDEHKTSIVDALKATGVSLSEQYNTETQLLKDVLFDHQEGIDFLRIQVAKLLEVCSTKQRDIENMSNEMGNLKQSLASITKGHNKMLSQIDKLTTSSSPLNERVEQLILVVQSMSTVLTRELRATKTQFTDTNNHTYPMDWSSPDTSIKEIEGSTHESYSNTLYQTDRTTHLQQVSDQSPTTSEQLVYGGRHLNTTEATKDSPLSAKPTGRRLLISLGYGSDSEEQKVKELGKNMKRSRQYIDERQAPQQLPMKKPKRIIATEETQEKWRVEEERLRRMETEL